MSLYCDRNCGNLKCKINPDHMKSYSTAEFENFKNTDKCQGFQKIPSEVTDGQSKT